MDGDTAGQVSLPSFDSLAAGFGNTCISSRGQVQCWGNGAKSVDGDQPSATSGIYQVAVGSNFACGFDTTDTAGVSCWGDNAPLIKASPSLSLGSNFDALPTLSAGLGHVCYALLTTVNCGANDYGQATAPKSLQVSIGAGKVAAGGHHTCAIDMAIGVQCWGENKYGQTDVPKDLKNPLGITSGFGHSCVLDDVGVHCWGRNDEGQVSVPLLKNPRMVQAGGYHTCAVDDDGVHCWGDNSFGQITVPNTLGSKISSLATGYLHTCAAVK